MPEAIKRFMNRRNKKKISIEGTKVSPSFGAGSHKLLALQKHHGIVKPTMAKKMERTEKKNKRKRIGG